MRLCCASCHVGTQRTLARHAHQKLQKTVFFSVAVLGCLAKVRAFLGQGQLKCDPRCSS